MRSLPKIRVGLVIGTIPWILVGCGAPAATPSVAPLEPGTPTSVPAEPTSTSAPNPSWMEVRDLVYGYGIAVPCWWWVVPTPSGGLSGVMTLHSYDDAYIQANSTKGGWNQGDYPPGAFKMDIGGWPVEDPSLSNLDAAVAAFTSDEQEVTLAEPVSIGRNAAVDVHTRSTVNPGSEGRLIVYRLDPDTLLFVSAYPMSAYDSPDIRGILESLALTPDQSIALPTYAPSQPVIAVPAGCPAP